MNERGEVGGPFPRFLQVRILKHLTFLEAFWNEQFQKVLEVRILMGLQGNIIGHERSSEITAGGHPRSAQASWGRFRGSHEKR
jgi:hypothetical protein